MATPVITASTRFFDPGITKVYYVPSIAATNLTPTRAELNAGTDLSPEMANWSGWTVTSQQIDTQDLSTTYTSKVGGRTVSADSSLEMYASKNGVDVKALLPLGTTGYICWMDGGDVAANKMSTFPVSVISCSQQRSNDKDVARVMVQFSITRKPGENLTVPA